MEKRLTQVIKMDHFIRQYGLIHSFLFVVDELREMLEFDQTALMEIQLALYVFQEAVS